MDPEIAKLSTSLSQACTRLLGLLEELEPDQRDELGVSGEWSPKDVVSHLIGWDRSFREFISEPDEFDPDPLYEIDIFNAKSVSERRHQSWEAILKEWQFTLSDLVMAINVITSDTRIYERVMSWLKGRIEDYQFHIGQLEKWIDQNR